MSTSHFLIALTVGAGALALWIHVRFPDLAPKSIRIAVVHVGAALLVGQLVAPAAHTLLPDGNAMLHGLLVTFAFGLPALIYALLSSIWVIQIAQGALRR